LLLAWSQRWPWLPYALAHRWLRHYGTRTEILIGEAQGLEDLGRHFGADLYQAEVDYLRRHEWARDTEDILWRRTKMGLHLDDGARAALAGYLADMPLQASAPEPEFEKDRA